VIVASLRLEVDRSGAVVAAAPEVRDGEAAITGTALDPQLAVATLPRTSTFCNHHHHHHFTRDSMHIQRVAKSVSYKQ